MEKQYHAWHWTTLASLHATVENLDHYIWSLQSGLDETQRMAYRRDREAVTEEEIVIAEADNARLREIEKLLFDAAVAVEKLRDLQDLIDALGTPADTEFYDTDDDGDDSDEPDFDVWEIADMAQALYPEAR